MVSTLSGFVKACCLIILLSVAACWQPTTVERMQILEAHLNLRENVKPTASNMKLMKYSERLEHLAALWASRCEFRHPSWSDPSVYHNLGQNLALVAGFEPTLTESVCGWKSETKFYSYNNRTCSRVCGHYTQIIWATTNELGCAKWRCRGVIPGWPEPQYLTVCQYNPPGNYENQQPYIKGIPCNRCGWDRRCLRKQCAGNAGYYDAYPLARYTRPEDKHVPKCRPMKSYNTVHYS